MTIAIDFEDTYDADPVLFKQYADAAILRGHTVLIVSSRAEGSPQAVEISRLVPAYLPIIFANSGWKRKAALRASYNVDVWVDNNPEYVALQDQDLAAQMIVNTIQAGAIRQQQVRQSELSAA